MRILDLIRKTIWAAGGVAAAKLILGVSVPLPDPAVLSAYLQTTAAPLLRFYNVLGGGALARGSVFALGIMPYLSARVFMLVATRVNAKAKSLSAGQTKWWTRGLTVGYSLIQSFGYAQFTEALPGAVSHPGLAYTVQTMAMLTSVSTLLMLFAEEATATGETGPEQLFLPRERAEVVSSKVRDPLYISHPTPLP